jgi:hypothetical protein
MNGLDALVNVCEAGVEPLIETGEASLETFTDVGEAGVETLIDASEASVEALIDASEAIVETSIQVAEPAVYALQLLVNRIESVDERVDHLFQLVESFFHLPLRAIGTTVASSAAVFQSNVRARGPTGRVL